MYDSNVISSAQVTRVAWLHHILVIKGAFFTWLKIGFFESLLQAPTLYNTSTSWLLRMNVFLFCGRCPTRTDTPWLNGYWRFSRPLPYQLGLISLAPPACIFTSRMHTGHWGRAACSQYHERLSPSNGQLESVLWRR